MKLFGISDLHLSFSNPKPMSVFGPHWDRHEERIRGAWQDLVGPEDVVLIPGDLSWAMRPDDAASDLAWLDALPGRKFFIRGNHDYWCGKTGKLRRSLPPSLTWVRHDAHLVGPIGICGTRGWLRPDEKEFDPPADGPIWTRELGRMKLALDALSKLSCAIRVVMTHFPPRSVAAPSGMSELIEGAGARLCVYGHLHADSLAEAFEGASGGVTYRCLSADHVAFAPVLLLEC